jgi:hypothetical protein
MGQHISGPKVSETMQIPPKPVNTIAPKGCSGRRGAQENSPPDEGQARQWPWSNGTKL